MAPELAGIAQDGKAVVEGEGADAANGIPLGDHDHRFGCVKPGWAADLVGVEGNFEDFDSTVDNVQFVMKSGKVYKMEGREVC